MQPDFYSYRLNTILNQLADATNKPYIKWEIAKLQHDYLLAKENERAALKEELINEILSKLSVSVDVSNAVSKINALNDAISSLGKK